MAGAFKFKRILTNMHKSESQTMDVCLREIKTIPDNLASSNYPGCQTDLVHYALMGLGREYETLVTTLTHMPVS